MSVEQRVERHDDVAEVAVALNILVVSTKLECRPLELMKSTTIAVDIAKAVFESAVSDEPGRIVERRRLARSKLREYFARRKPATVRLEACRS